MIGLSLLCFCLLLQSALAQTTASVPLNIAVGEFEANGLPASDVNILTDRLRGELMGTGVFRVMERSQMDAILSEQSFQQSGACNSSECQVKVGQLLSVDRMVVGSIGLLGGDLYTISARLLDVGSGEVVITANTQYKGDISEVLSQLIPEVARKLASSAGAKKRHESQIKNMAGRTGDLYIESTVAGAPVFLDGLRVDGKTPLTLRGIPAGRHVIEVRTSEASGIRKIMLKPDDLLRINVSTKKGVGGIKVFSLPLNATVFFDGQKIGYTPLKLDSIVAGSHILRLESPGYLPLQDSLHVDLDSFVVRNDTLHLGAWLNLQIHPEGTKVFFNGKPQVRADFRDLLLSSGRLAIRVEKEDYVPWSDTLNLVARQTITRKVNLLPLYGSLSVKASVPATVALNGVIMGRTPWVNSRLQPGHYLVQVSADDYKTMVDSFDLVAGQRVSRNVTLEPRYAKLSVSSSVPATATLNGTVLGHTPCESAHLEPGHYRLQVAAADYQTIKDSFDLIAGQSLSRNVTLQSIYAKLLVKSSVPATVSLNGTVVDRTPLASERLQPGHYQMQVSANDYKTEEVSLDLVSGQTINLDLILQPLYGTLLVTSSEPAMLTLNGVQVGVTPWQGNRLEPGHYRLRLDLDSYEPVEDSLQLAAGNRLEKKYHLQHTQPWQDSAFHAHVRWTARIVSGLVAAGGGIYSLQKAIFVRNHREAAQDAYDDYLQASSDFDSYKAIYDDELDQMHDAKTRRNIGSAIACVGVLSFGVTFVF
ncbi:MAG TPA: PEGA domain-containing protein [Fibrobacteraceae bacterium]|nr:PEGA domain-containing protein [Fibrobacteraceae bacterium]